MISGCACVCLFKQPPYIYADTLQFANVCVKCVGKQTSATEPQPRFTTLLISAWTGTDGAGSERSHLDAPVRPCKAAQSTPGPELSTTSRLHRACSMSEPEYHHHTCMHAARLVACQRVSMSGSSPFSLIRSRHREKGLLGDAQNKTPPRWGRAVRRAPAGGRSRPAAAARGCCGACLRAGAVAGHVLQRVGADACAEGGRQRHALTSASPAVVQAGRGRRAHVALRSAAEREHPC